MRSNVSFCLFEKVLSKTDTSFVQLFYSFTYISDRLSVYLAHVWWSVHVGICPTSCSCQPAFILYGLYNRVLSFKLPGSWWTSSSAITVNFIRAIMIQNKGRGNGWKTQRGGRFLILPGSKILAWCNKKKKWYCFNNDSAFFFKVFSLLEFLVKLNV